MKRMDPRVREYITPVRVVWSEGNVRGAENLFREAPLQSTLGDQPGFENCVLDNRGSDTKAALLLDFGKELHGTVKIVIQAASKGPALHIRYGESVSEAMSDPGERHACNDHAPRDQVFRVCHLCNYETNESGFRFVRIDLLEPNKFIELRAVVAVAIYRDLPYIGSFSCSDPLLEQIWKTAAYTAHLNMQEYLWDGIKRDRLVWIGDMQTEVMTILSVFGAHEVVPKSMDLVRNETPPTQWMNTLSSYSMWWILLQYDWYLGTGDLAYLTEQRDYLIALLAHLRTQVGPDGRDVIGEGLPNKMEHHFLDWPNSGNPIAARSGVHAIFYMALRRGAYLLRILDCGEEATLCDACADRMRVPCDPNGSKQAGAMLVMAGLADPKKMHDEVLAPGGAHGYSTFLGYYTLEAMVAAGDVVGALDHLRAYWGGMLQMGATTFWEDFNLDWMENTVPIDQLVPEGKRDIHGDCGAYCYNGFRHSFCHGWSSGPVPFLMRTVLGIQVLEPGCRALRITPKLGDLTYASGTYPTPFGPVSVSHRKAEDGTVKTEIKAPDEIRIETV